MLPGGGAVQVEGWGETQDTPPGVLAGKEAGGALCGEVPGVLGLGAGQSWCSRRASPELGPAGPTPVMAKAILSTADPQRLPGVSEEFGGTRTLHRKSGRETCPPRFAVGLAAFQLPGWSGPGIRFCR